MLGEAGLRPRARKRSALALQLLVVTAALVAPVAPATAQPTTFVRGVYGRDTSATNVAVIKDTGFNAVDVMPARSELDHLQTNGLKGVVSLHMYSNASCTFDKDDAWVRDTVLALKDHPAVQAWQITDEPNAAACPTAPAQIRARHELVKRLDPGHDTYVTIALWDGRSLYPYEDFARTTDVMGLVVYPCGGGQAANAPCDFSFVDKAIAEAERDGVPRYWAVVQGFEDDLGHRMPTTGETTEQFDRWRGSRMEGYFVFHWGWGSLQSRPAHLSALKTVNARYAGGPSATPAPTPAATPSPSPSPTPSDGSVIPDRPSPVDSPPPDDLVPGTNAPTVPRPVDLQVRLRGKRDVRLTWGLPVGARPVARYEVVRDGRVVAKVTEAYLVDRPNRWVGHVYEVSALDSLGNRSEPARIHLAPRPSDRRRRTLSCPPAFGELCRVWTFLHRRA